MASTPEELYTLLSNGATSVSLLKPMNFTRTNWPTTLVISRSVSLSSPYRVILDFCDDVCNSATPAKLRPLINVTGSGSLLLSRVFIRNYFPAAPTNLAGFGPVPALMSAGGQISFRLVVFHWRKRMTWAFFQPENSFWQQQKGRMWDVRTLGPVQVDTPALYAIGFERADYSILTCYAPMDVDGCFEAAPADHTLIYCPYTFADSLRNPHVHQIFTFGDIGVDRLSYDYRSPNNVMGAKTYTSCPGTVHSMNFDDALQGVVVDTGASVTLKNLIIQGTVGNNFTTWLKNSPILLSMFVLRGDGSVQLDNCTIRVRDVVAQANTLLSLPGQSSDPTRPNLRPQLSSEVTDSGFRIESWVLSWQKWLQYASSTFADITLPTSAPMYWSFTNTIVNKYQPKHCFQGAVEQGGVLPDMVTRVANDVQLHAALADPAVRYIEMVADITLHHGRWAEALLVQQGVLEIRACHPTPGRRYTLDLSNLVDVMRVSGRLFIQGDIRVVGLAWSPATLAQQRLVAAFSPTNGRGEVEFQGVVLEGKLQPGVDKAAVLEQLRLDGSLAQTTKVLNATILGDSVLFGIFPCVVNTTTQSGTISFVQSEMVTQRHGSGSSSVPVAAIVVPAVVGGCLLLAAVVGLVLWRRRRAGSSKQPSVSSSEDFNAVDKQHAEAKVDVFVDKDEMGTGSNAPGSPRFPEIASAGSRSRMMFPGEDINAARRDLVSARTSATLADDIVLVSVLGEGSYGKVYKATWRGTLVAVKVIQLPACMTGREKREKMAVMEAAISSSLSHPNVVQTYTYSCEPVDSKRTLTSSVTGTHTMTIQDSTNMTPDERASKAATESDMQGWEVRLVQEYCDEGSLRDKLNEQAFLRGNGGQVALEAVLDTAIDIARAMSHLHRENIVHSDLKARNVLLKGSTSDARKWVAKVADFGLSIRMDPNDTHISNAYQGTITHMAPETLLYGHISRACDVYAFGILLWELYTGGHAFKGIPKALLGFKIAKEHLRPQFPYDVPFEYHLLVSRCWESQPDIRPDFSTVLEELKRLRAKLGGPNFIGSIGAERSAVTSAEAAALQGQPQLQPQWGLPPLASPHHSHMMHSHGSGVPEQQLSRTDNCLTTDHHPTEGDGSHAFPSTLNGGIIVANAMSGSYLSSPAFPKAEDGRNGGGGNGGGGMA